MKGLLQLPAMWSQSRSFSQCVVEMREKKGESPLFSKDFLIICLSNLTFLTKSFNSMQKTTSTAAILMKKI